MSYYLIRHFQKNVFKAGNSFEPQEKPGRKEIKTGCTLYHDIAYAAEYPNSYLDIYVHPDAKKVSRCTYFYVHGGGYTWGDKTDGDPNAQGDDRSWFFEGFMEAGYNIVSINYALAPDYMYPTPIIQMGQAVEFLKVHGAEYGIDMRKIIFGGGSAGGQLIGQFINIQTNPAYAKKMKLAPVLHRDAIKAVLFNSALLDNERFGKTDTAVLNFLFVRCGRAYFHCWDLPGNELAVESDVIRNLTENFPPSFISDGNTGSFTDQNMDLDKRMTELKIKHVLNIHPRSEAKLGHGFESMGDFYGRDNLRKMLDFLEDLKINGKDDE